MTEQVMAPSSEWGALQRRTVTWHDPAPTAMAGLAMPGLDYLRAMHEGRMPVSPIARLVGLEAVSLAAGEVRYRCVADPSAYNPIGLIHGGLLCTLLDSATASAVHTTLDAGVGFSTIELSVSYLRPVHAGDELLVHGWVVKPGRRVSYAAADIRDTQDRVIATATSSLLIMPLA